MAEVATGTLARDVKLFGRRVTSFADTLEGLAEEAEGLRRGAAEAVRRLGWWSAAVDEGFARHDLLRAFLALSGVVEGLDRVPRSHGAAVEASALAQEGADLCATLYDLVAE